MTTHRYQRADSANSALISAISDKLRYQRAIDALMAPSALSYQRAISGVSAISADISAE